MEHQSLPNWNSPRLDVKSSQLEKMITSVEPHDTGASTSQAGEKSRQDKIPCPKWSSDEDHVDYCKVFHCCECSNEAETDLIDDRHTSRLVKYESPLEKMIRSLEPQDTGASTPQGGEKSRQDKILPLMCSSDEDHDYRCCKDFPCCESSDEPEPDLKLKSRVEKMTSRAEPQDTGTSTPQAGEKSRQVEIPSPKCSSNEVHDYCKVFHCGESSDKAETDETDLIDDRDTPRLVESKSQLEKMTSSAEPQDTGASTPQAGEKSQQDKIPSPKCSSNEDHDYDCCKDCHCGESSDEAETDETDIIDDRDASDADCKRLETWTMKGKRCGVCRSDELFRKHSMDAIMVSTSFITLSGLIVRDSDSEYLVEIIFTDHLRFDGIIEVPNRCANKDVWVRFTTEEWNSFHDVKALYQTDTSTGQFSIYSFGFPIPAGFAYGDVLEMAIRVEYHDIETVVWDNNDSDNYKFIGLLTDRNLPKSVKKLLLVQPLYEMLCCNLSCNYTQSLYDIGPFEFDERRIDISDSAASEKTESTVSEETESTVSEETESTISEETKSTKELQNESADELQNESAIALK